MAYQVCGLPRSKSPKWQYLRYCKDCWEEDIRTYGEAYWHRLHLLPGILICPVHGIPIRDSRIFLKDVQSKFYPASFEWVLNEKASVFYSDDTAKKLMAVAEDSAWVMGNGSTLGFSDTMIEIYDQLLRFKGYQSLSGRKNKSLLLDKDICEFYGQELLDVLGVHSEGVVTWSERIMNLRTSLLYPVYYLLLMRFLAGSAEDFFTKQHGVAHPYGAGPWPCRNPVCPYYLKDVIVKLPLVQFASRHQATFICPYCGFSYRRSREKQKSHQYSGYINKVDYGWLWMDTFKEMMKSGEPIMHITEKLQCGFHTVKRLGVELGFFPADQLPKKKIFVSRKKALSEPIPKPTSKAYYRKQWLQAMKENSGASRSKLIKVYPEVYKWLRKNDLTWYETHAPASKKSVFEWAEKDADNLKKAMAGVAYLQNMTGKPVWINRNSVEKYGGMNNLYKNMSLGYIPKTKAYLDENLETDEEWRRRKIRWAVKTLYAEDKPLYLPQIKIKAAISPKMFDPLEEFVLDCILQIQKNEEKTKKQSM